MSKTKTNVKENRQHQPTALFPCLSFSSIPYGLCGVRCVRLSAILSAYKLHCTVCCGSLACVAQRPSIDNKTHEQKQRASERESAQFQFVFCVLSSASHFAYQTIQRVNNIQFAFSHR